MSKPRLLRRAARLLLVVPSLLAAQPGGNPRDVQGRTAAGRTAEARAPAGPDGKAHDLASAHNPPAAFVRPNARKNPGR